MTIVRDNNMNVRYMAVNKGHYQLFAVVMVLTHSRTVMLFWCCTLLHVFRERLSGRMRTERPPPSPLPWSSARPLPPLVFAFRLPLSP